MDIGIRTLHSGTLSGHVRDVPWLPGTLGWDGQWDCSHLEWDAWDVSGMSLGFWDGMDSGIAAT